MLLDRDGVGVELSREAYEAGDWANKGQEAYSLGKKEKARKRTGWTMDGRERQDSEDRPSLVSASRPPQSPVLPTHPGPLGTIVPIVPQISHMGSRARRMRVLSVCHSR